MTAVATIPLDPTYVASRGLDDAARALLDSRAYAVLGTENPDGSPHLAPVMFLFDGERLLAETSAATRKARNVAATGRARLLVQAPDASWVSGDGPATVVRGPEATRLSDPIRAKYLTPAGLAAVGAILAELDDVTIVIRPQRWLRWDLGGFLATAAARGLDLAGADDWFVA